MPTFLTPEQRDVFQRTGVLRLPGIAQPDALAAAQGFVRHRLELAGLWQAGAWRAEAMAAGKSQKTRDLIGNKHPALAALFETPPLATAIDELMGGREVDRQIHRRPQVLFTLPNADAWSIPPYWHTDGVRLASGRSLGVQAWAFIEPVGPRGGGTGVIAGSHRLANEPGRVLKAKGLRRVLEPLPFFRDYWKDAPLPWPDDAPLPRGRVGEVEVEVMELTGAPGDVWITDLHVLHSGAPNAAATPRVMVTSRFLAREVVRELAEVHGWI